MALLLEVAGLLAAAAIIAQIRPGSGASVPRSAAVAAAVSAVSAVLAAGLLWPALRDQVSGSNLQARTPEASISYTLASQQGTRQDFLLWVESRMPAHASYFFAGSGTALLWAGYQLLPRLPVDDPRKAAWIVMNGRPAPGGIRLGAVRRFAGGYAIAPVLAANRGERAR